MEVVEVQVAQKSLEMALDLVLVERLRRRMALALHSLRHGGDGAKTSRRVTRNLSQGMT